MMVRGYAPYRQVFDSQPPLWLPLIYASLRVFGESFRAGQLVMATAGLITIAAVMLIARQLGGRGASLLAATLVILSPLELQWSRTINADVPSVALAAAGIALAAGYVRHGRRGWLTAAATATICSILLKLSGIYAVPSLILFAIARWTHAQEVSRRQRLRYIALDILIIFVVFAAITVLSLLSCNLSQVWHQAVTFHLAARRVYPSVPLDERWHTLMRLMIGERLLLAAAPLAGLCMLGGIDGVALFAWPFVTFLGLLNHFPLFDHHLIALIPALAAAIGVGAGYSRVLYVVFVRWLDVQAHSIRIFGWTACAGAGLVILGAGVRQACLEASNELAFIRSQALPSPDLRIAELIIEHTRPGEMIITDAQGIAFLAGRDVPPALTDTSFTRIATGYLRAQEVIDQAQQYNVRLMLLWTQRLSSMPEVVQWAGKHFPRRVDLGPGRTLYMTVAARTRPNSAASDLSPVTMWTPYQWRSRPLISTSRRLKAGGSSGFNSSTSLRPNS
jgi:hypothetical protein